MNSHDYFKSKLSEFATGELSTETEEELKSHITECPECSNSVASLKETLNTFSIPIYEMPPGSYFTSLAFRIREKAEESSNKFSLSFFYDLRWAGAFVLTAVVIGSVIFLNELDRDVSAPITSEDSNYYYSLLPSEDYTISSLNASLDTDDWELLSEVIEDEFGVYTNIYQPEEEGDKLDQLSENEWQYFYEKFEQQSIL